MPDSASVEQAEIEAKLVVGREHRREIVRAFLDLRELGPYVLLARPPRDLRDRYFDTSEGDLERFDVAVRLREVDGGIVVTLKGPTEVLEGGALARFELEDAWSPRALGTVVAKLRGWGIALRDAVSALGDPPERALEATGLRRIHERAVRRVVREATSRDDPTADPHAELVLDAVTFDVAGRPIRHDEIEVEGRGSDSAAHVRTVVGELRARFGDGLRAWRPSKLAIGQALEDIARDPGLDPLVDGEGRLSSEAYDEIVRRVGTR